MLGKVLDFRYLKILGERKNQGQFKMLRKVETSLLIFCSTMTSVTANYTSPTHSLNVNHKVQPSDGSVKASFEALSQALRATQTELNVFLTERKLEEDRANGVNGTSLKRKVTEDDDIENEDEAEEDE